MRERERERPLICSRYDHRTPLVQWSLYKYECCGVWGVRVGDQVIPTYRQPNNHLSFKLCYSNCFTDIKNYCYYLDNTYQSSYVNFLHSN